MHLQDALEGQQKQVAKKKKSKLTDKSWTNHIKAAYLLILGIGITILLANPLMETIQDFSTAASIPTFFTSYVLVPLAVNYGQALQAITSARVKSENAISLTLSEVCFPLELISCFMFASISDITTFISFCFWTITTFISNKALIYQGSEIYNILIYLKSTFDRSPNRNIVTNLTVEMFSADL